MSLQAGFGRTLINPPSHIPAGTWMAQKHVRASGLDMDLRATALVLSDGPLSVAIIDLDLCFLSDTQAAALRQAVHESTGIAPDRVLPFCSASSCTWARVTRSASTPAGRSIASNCSPVAAAFSAKMQQ